MNQAKDRLQNLMLYVLDIVSLIVSYILSGVIWAVLYKRLGSALGIINILENEIGTLFISYVVVILFFNMNKDFIKRGRFEELKYAFKMNFLFMAIFGVLLFLMGDRSSIPRGIYLLTPFINIILMFILHLLLKLYLLKVRKRGKKSNKMFIITTGDRAESVIREIRNNHSWRYSIDGIILVDGGMRGEEIDDIPIVADFYGLLDYCRTQVVDEVLINLPYDDGESLKELIMSLEDMGVTVHMSISRLNEFSEFSKSLNMIGNMPVVTFANVFHDENKLLIKRLIDILGAIVGLIITGIVTVFLAPVLLIESPGPLVFKQKRVGKNGRYFYIYKFRSMYKDAEERKKELMDKNEMNGLMFKMTDDPRITKVGKFIRKTSIDELPQFLNVLKGDMSLVGTRPPTVDEFKQYEGHHKRRLSMKPGITGLWQVSGRSDIEDFEEVVKLDLQYIDNWGIGQDFKILIKTFWVILFGRGAK